MLSEVKFFANVQDSDHDHTKDQLSQGLTST